MKKLIKGLLITLFFIILLFVVYVLVTFPPIMGGMAAKTVCSCVFVSNRTLASVMKKELQVFPGLDEVDIEIDLEDSTVTGHLLWQRSKAVFRKGLGCTLLSQADETTLRSQRFVTYDHSFPDQDTIPWPMGDMHAITTSLNADRIALDKVVNDAFEEHDPEKPRNTHAVIVIYDGKIISERYAEGFTQESVFTGWSMTKSITNALIGVLVRERKLKLSGAAPIAEWQGDDRKKITINHLLQASSGLTWSESYFIPGADFHNMFIHSDDKAGYALRQKAQYRPGEYFEYSSGTTNILSKIIRQTVGDGEYHSFPYERLFAKVGMYHALLEPDASGTFVASSYGFASARDWARLGLLYLNDGVWNGERILPEGWVEYSTTPAPAAPRREYGAHIWLNRGEKTNPSNMKFPGLPQQSVIFSGFEDNFVVIVPSYNLVVVRLGVTHNGSSSIADLVNGIIRLLPEANNLAEQRQETR